MVLSKIHSFCGEGKDIEGYRSSPGLLSVKYIATSDYDGHENRVSSTLQVMLDFLTVTRIPHIDCLVGYYS